MNTMTKKMDEQKTVAQRVALEMGDNGQVYERADGRSLHDVAIDYQASITTADSDGVAEPGGLSPDARRYEFTDGSAIVDTGYAWDIEGSMRWSWESVE